MDVIQFDLDLGKATIDPEEAVATHGMSAANNRRPLTSTFDDLGHWFPPVVKNVVRTVLAYLVRGDNSVFLCG